MRRCTCRDRPVSLPLLPRTSRGGQSECAENQHISRQDVERDGGKCDPERGLGPVDRAHKAAHGYEPPARDHTPSEAGEILPGKARSFRLLSKREENALAVELNDEERH